MSDVMEITHERPLEHVNTWRPSSVGAQHKVPFETYILSLGSSPSSANYYFGFFFSARVSLHVWQSQIIYSRYLAHICSAQTFCKWS